jgi:hypothetical protein
VGVSSKTSPSHTRQYRADCTRIFGHYVDHEPAHLAPGVRAAPTGGQAVAAIDPSGPREQFKSMPGFLPTDVGIGATAQPAGLGLLVGFPHPKPLEGA